MPGGCYQCLPLQNTHKAGVMCRHPREAHAALPCTLLPPEQARDNPIPTSGFRIIVPITPFGMPDYDQDERFDLRVSAGRIWLMQLCEVVCIPGAGCFLGAAPRRVAPRAGLPRSSASSPPTHLRCRRTCILLNPAAAFCGQGRPG